MKEQAERKDFMRFLNRNYYIHSHLTERLDELRDSPLFSDYQQVISDTIKLIENQLVKIEHLFDTLMVVSSLHESRATIKYMESLFTMIREPGNNTPIVALLDYVAAADALMAANAELAKLSFAKTPGVSLPDGDLYDMHTLQLLKNLLNNNLVAN